MIVVKIEMYPKGREEGSYPLGVMVITNDGTGTQEAGNYKYTISHAGVHLGKRKEPYKQGRVRGFRRTASPYRLVQRCLKDAGEI